MADDEPRAGSARSDLLRELTREARTALSAIDGYSELLGEDLCERHPPALADLERIRSASRQVLALVARLEQLVDHERAEAALDPLTGVANRRSLVSRAEALFQSGAPLSVVMVDVDRFKEINDRYGHLAGDEVLRTVAERCRGAVRDSDLLGRLAGDEFLLLLPDTEHGEATRVASRIRASVGGHPVVTSRGPVSVTVSVGVACRVAEDAAVEPLIERVDRAMYAAKAEGRNRVVTFS